MPFSNAVTVAVEGKRQRRDLGVEIKVHGPKGVTCVGVVNSMGIGKIDRSNKKPFGDQLVASYWLVRPVQDKNMPNMRKSTMTCTMTVEVWDEAAPHRVTLPILQNVKALKKGDELVRFHEPAPKSIMPAQKLEQPTMKRPAAATHRMQKPAKKR